MLPADFNWERYLSMNIDLLQAGITTEQQVTNHYLTYGFFERRKYKICNYTAQAYVICKNCSYSEKLTNRVLVLNRMSSSKNSSFDNFSKYKYMKYDNTLPHTRDYVCKNKSCKTNTDYKLKDAKWFRPNGNNYTTFYICCVCDTIWNIA
jgi:DNA-directed RNA polymerase subunit M/transcription elongation factor TFIIS